MNDLVKKGLIALSVLTGVIFAATICYAFGSAFLQSRAEEPDTLTADVPAQVEGSPPANASPSSVNAPSKISVSRDLTWDGLRIEIANINYDAWPLIKAQNSNNEPPPIGMAMLMITARVSNVEGSAEEPVSLTASDFQLIGDRNTVYKRFEVSCGVVPDGLDSTVAQGNFTDGNICFQVSKDEANFQLIYEPFGSPAIYFDLPQPKDAAWETPEPPPALVDAESLTPDGLKVDIVNIDYDAWPLIKSHNSYNDPPLDGMTMLLITLRITNVSGRADGPAAVRDSDFKLIGSRKTVYETFEVSCGVVPDSLNSVVSAGDYVEAQVCFQISGDESNFQLVYEPHDTPASYYDLPVTVEGK